MLPTPLELLVVPALDEVLVPLLLLNPDELLVPLVPAGLELLPTPAELALVPVVLEAPDTPLHGATVGEVVAPPLGVIVTPATLQFIGIICSMISTKLS